MLFGEPFGGAIPGARGAVLAFLLRTGEPMTGRQVHGLVSDDYSLWSVQAALGVLTRLGLVESRTIERAGVHTINDGHAFVPPPAGTGRSDGGVERRHRRGDQF